MKNIKERATRGDYADEQRICTK